MVGRQIQTYLAIASSAIICFIYNYTQIFAKNRDTLIEQSILQIIVNILHKSFLNKNKQNYGN